MDDKLKQLREKAEKLLNENHSEKNDIPITEFNKVVHDLKVYQIELELQNEELRNTQKQHEDSRNKYAQLFNQAPAGYVTLNQKSIVLQANQTFAKMVNRELDQIVNSSFANFIETSDRTIFLSRYNAFFKNPAEKNMELKIEKKGGKSFFAKIAGNLKTDDSFENKQDLLQPKLFLIITDITREKIAEKRLVESENNLRSFADSGQALIYTTDTDKLRNYFNKVWLNFTGHTEEMEFGEGWVSGMYADDYERTNQIFNTSFDNRLPYSLEYRLKRHDGEYRWLRDDGCPRYNSMGLFIGYIGYCLDVTESKQVEIELRKSREKSEELSTELEAILDHIPGLVFYKDKLNNFIRVNKFLADAYHKQKSEFEGVNLDKIYPVDLANQYYPDDLAVINSGIPKLNYEENWDTAAGMKWISTSKIPFVDHKGEIKGVIGISTDITERKKAEEALRKSEILLREAGRLAKLGGWEIDLVTNKLTWTEETYHIHEVPTGIKPRIEDGIHFYALEAQPIIKEAIEQAINEGKPFDLELPFITKKGNHLWVRSIGNVDKQNGKATRIYGVFQDITERKKAEEDLKQFSARLALATRAGGVGVWDWDLRNDALLWDDQMFILYGVAKENFNGAYSAWQAGLHPDDKERGDIEIQKAIKGEKEFNTEFRVIWPDGSIRYIRALAYVQRDKSGKPLRMVGTNWDITEQKMAEAEIRTKNEELEKLNSEKDRFFSIIAHDLRGPFNGFLGLTQIMAEQLKSLTLNELQDISKGLNQSANNLFNLLNNLLEWARMQRGSTSFEPKPVMLLPFATATVQPIVELANKKGIEMSLHIPENLQVNADQNMLSSTLRNLASNAVKFTAAGGKVNLSATTTADDYTQFSVKDTGIGMDAETLANMFKLDVSISRKGTDGEPSTGLGLLLCKDFIGKHGGKIWVESEEGKGSTFYFTLPAKA
jgi:PAS domain S-box-containing protein